LLEILTGSSCQELTQAHRVVWDKHANSLIEAYQNFTKDQRGVGVKVLSTSSDLFQTSRSLQPDIGNSLTKLCLIIRLKPFLIEDKLGRVQV
jgi:hypothetical protein